MKKLILFALAFGAVSAQSQDVFDTMALETCNCIKSKRPSLETTSSEELKADYLNCFLTSYSANADAISKVESVNLQDQTQMERFGEQVAMKMLTHCPDYLIALGTAFEEEEQAEIVEESRYFTVDGEISDIKTEQFVTIIVKDQFSKTHNLLFMDYFDSAALYTDSKIKKKDKISVTYSEVEMYDPKLKEFRYFKVIAGLEKK